MSEQINRAWQWWTRVNVRFGSLFLFLCIITSTSACVGVWVQSRTNASQDAAYRADQKARTVENTRLLHCFDRFATDLAGSLPVVRKASAWRNAALTDALIGDDKHLGLGLLLLRAKQGVKSDPKRDLANLLATFQRFQRADRHLIAVQKANPYPDPPSKFCDLP